MPNPDKPSWKMRRIAIFSWLFFCGMVIGYVLVLGDPDSDIHKSALAWAFGSAAVTIFGYAGWATIEDISLFRLLR